MTDFQREVLQGLREATRDGRVAVRSTQVARRVDSSAAAVGRALHAIEQNERPLLVRRSWSRGIDSEGVIAWWLTDAGMAATEPTS